MDFEIWSKAYYLQEIQIRHTYIFHGIASQTLEFWFHLA